MRRSVHAERRYNNNIIIYFYNITLFYIRGRRHDIHPNSSPASASTAYCRRQYGVNLRRKPFVIAVAGRRFLFFCSPFKSGRSRENRLFPLSRSSRRVSAAKPLTRPQHCDSGTRRRPGRYNNIVIIL